LTKINPQVRAREAEAPNVLISREGAAHRLGNVNVRTIDRMRQRGELAPVRVGRRVLFRIRDVDAIAGEAPAAGADDA
jgi:excisionase family DNA binding protein